MSSVGEEELVEPDMTYTKELRAATKDVHKLTDILVNAKFAIALTDDMVWADGLLSFYEIYKFLESNLPNDLLPKELHRTEAFEKDFVYFWGENWKDSYEIRPVVRKYLDHLEEINKKNKILLFAYAYQMYMALMSGGQLLQRKRMIARKLFMKTDKDNEIDNETTIENTIPIEPNDLTTRPMPKQVTVCPNGCAATYFPEKIADLKIKLRTILNKHYSKFDEEMKSDFIEESRNVFRYNSDVIRAIKGVNRANLRKIAYVGAFLFAIYVAIKMGSYHLYN